MIGLLADVGSGLSDLLSLSASSVGLNGPVGLSSSDDGGGSIGLDAGVGLEYDAGSRESVGLNGGVGLFA